MALEDKDIFKAICERNPGQPIEYIMQQYEVARQINREIEKRAEPAPQCEAEPVVEEITETIVEEAAPPKKKYSRRNLKVKPKDAIQEDVIFCCICGEPRQSITVKHLANHDITVDEYKKLCGYAPNQPLMSMRRLEKSKEIIARAQQARLRKAAENNE